MMLKTSRVLWEMTIEFGDWELFLYMPGYTRISLDAWAELPFLYISCRHLFFLCVLELFVPCECGD